MEIRFDPGPALIAELRAALADRAHAGPERLVGALAALAAASIATPLSPDAAGAMRLGCAALAACAAFFIGLGAARAWRRLRRRNAQAATRGLEKGARTLRLTGKTLTERRGPQARCFRWRAFAGAVETPRALALIVSDRECVALPKETLSPRGLRAIRRMARTGEDAR